MYIARRFIRSVGEDNKWECSNKWEFLLAGRYFQVSICPLLASGYRILSLHKINDRKAWMLVYYTRQMSWNANKTNQTDEN